MQFSLTDLQKEIKENAEKLLSEKIDALETIRKIDENTRLDEELWRLVIEQGWLALDVPEEEGGLGFSIVDTAILSEVLGYYMPIIPLFSSGIVFKQLVMHSSDELKGRILPEIISGEKIGSFAIYENDKYEINKENISPFRRMHVWDKNGNGAIHFESASICEPTMGYIIPHRDILDALHKRICDLENVRHIKRSITHKNKSGS